MNPTLHSIFIQELEELCEKGLIRKLKSLSGHEGTRARWEGRELILFCGNDYLGLSRHPQVIEKTIQALKTYGAGAGASRLISGTSEVHSRLEKELAQFKRKEGALVFGSGYLANLGVLSALAGEKDLIVMDKLSHASLIDGARLSGASFRVFGHRRYEKCEEILKKSAAFSRRILVSDSVFSMDGDLADLDELVRLKEKYDCLLVIDDAHGIGVYGPEGRGATEGREEKIDFLVGTLSKSLGVFGGFVAASGLLIDHVINFSRPFIFATAPPAFMCQAALEALYLIQKEPSLRAKLWSNVKEIERSLPGGMERTGGGPIFPLMIGDEKEALQISEELLEKGIFIPAIRYPTVQKGKARLRLTVSARHTQEDLKQLHRHCEAVFKRMSPPPEADPPLAEKQSL